MRDEEQEAVEAEAAHQQQMVEDLGMPAEGETIVAHGALEIRPANNDIPQDEPDEVINPLDIPDHYDLPFFGSTVACMKCGNGEGSDNGDRAFKTEYHQAGVLGQPCGTTFGWPQVQNLGEHLCRTCKRCGYGFPEAVQHG